MTRLRHPTRRTPSRRRPLLTRRQRRRRGMVTVEFALTASLLFLLFLSSIDFARVNLIRHIVNNAAFEAARSSIVPGVTVQDVRDRADSMLAVGFVVGATVEVSPGTITDTTEEVVVTITVPLNANQWVLSTFFAGKQIVRTSTVAREDY